MRMMDERSAAEVILQKVEKQSEQVRAQAIEEELKTTTEKFAKEISELKIQRTRDSA